MAMSLDTAIKFTAKLEGSGLDQLKRGLQGMAQQANRSSKDLDQLYNANKKLSQAAGQSLNSLQRQITVMTNLRNEAQIGSRQFKFYSAELEKLNKQQAKVTGAGSGRGGVTGLLAMGGGLGGLAAAAGGTLAVKYVADVGMQAESAQVRLRALTNQFGEYNQAQAATERIARTLRISNTEAQESFASLYASLRPTGITLQELEKAFIGFSAAARNSGATAQETSNALIQLKQGLASGVLQGEELRSIREQAPLAAQAIAKELGVTIGELKDLASEGKVTTDVVLRALGKLQETQLGKLNEQFNTGAQAMKDLQIATERLGIQIAKTFGPTAIKLIQAFTRVLERAADLAGGGGEGQARLAAQLVAQSEARKKFGVFGALINRAEVDAFIKQRTDAIVESNRQAAAKARDKAQELTPEQKADQEAARKERLAAQARAQQEGDKERRKALEDELKIRQDTERRLADFREQSIQRAAELERDLGDQRKELERSTAEARRRIQQQQQDFALEAERQRLRASGLGTDALDTQARLNEATRRYTEQKIQIEQNATDKKVQLERTLEQYKLSVAEGIRNILVDAAEKMADKMRQGAQGAAAAMTGGMSMAPGGIIARTGNTGQSTGAHLDARFADGRPITAADVDRYLRVNGRAPSSFGVTSPFGPRNLFGRSFHSGIDFGTPAGSGISLQNGAKVLRDLGFTGAGGYAVEIDTPQGRMRLLHLQGGSVARPIGSARQMIGRPGGVDLSGVDRAGARLDQAIGANRQAQGTAALGDLIGSRQGELANITGQLDQQRRSVREQREDYERMLELQRSGLSPELARQAVERERFANAERASLQVLEQQLVKDLESKDLTAEQRRDLEAILQTTRDRLVAQDGVVQALSKEEQVLEQLKAAYERKKELVEGIANSIGNGIGSAIDLLIEGTDNWGNSLREIAAGVLKDIARQIAQTMVIAPIVKGITGMFGFANGGVMTASGPMELRRYARGGIANSPQLALFGEGSKPEAYVPLPDGRRIPVAMQGGGGGTTSVVVNVDAKGTQVQGNNNQGEALGRAISSAVQQELIKQRRPGGLLAA